MSEEKRELETAEAAGAAGESTPAQRPDRLEDTVYDWARSLIAAVVGVVLLFTFLVRLIGVSGPSMQNTLYTGDRILVLNSLLCDFQPGDVVVVNAYNAPLDETLVKRIIAVGGQTVDIDFITGTVYVDGVALEEDYIKEEYWDLYAENGVNHITVPEGHIYVMGDNRNGSSDSRDPALGVVDVRCVIGQAVVLAFPGPDEATGQRDFGRVGLMGGVDA